MHSAQKNGHGKWSVMVSLGRAAKMIYHTINTKEKITQSFAKNKQQQNTRSPRGDGPGIFDERHHLRYCFEYLKSNRDKWIAIHFVQLVYFACDDKMQNRINTLATPKFPTFFVGFGFMTGCPWYKRVDRICLSSNVGEN